MAEREQAPQYLLDGAQMTLTAVIAGTMGFLKERGIPQREWTAYIGAMFTGSWSVFEDAGANEVLGHIVPLQVESMGADIISGDGGPDKAEVTVGSLPNRALLEKFGATPRGLLGGFGVTQKDYAGIYDLFKAPAKAAGFTFSHKAGKGQQVLTLKRRKGGPAR